MKNPSTLLALLLVGGCGSEAEAPAAPTAAPETLAVATAPEADAPVGEDAPDEACMRGVLVSYAGAQGAAETMTREKSEAQARATELRERVTGGEALAAVARTDGDGSRAARGGQLGTFHRDQWPDLYGPLKDAVFGLPVGGISPVLEAPFGYVFVERCPVERVHTRHILVRYRGAQRAEADVTRSKDEARALAQRLHGELAAGGGFGALARAHSEDGSAEQGGDVGVVARGLLEPEYEEAAFALAPGQVAAVVETRVGFHVIQRLPAER